MDISKIEPGNKNMINVFVESEKGSKNCYEYDAKLGLFKLKKVLKTAFPGSHGFIPKTHHVDGKTLDVLVLSSDTIRQGTLVQVKPIGSIRMKADIPDIVLIAVPVTDEDFSVYKNITEIGEDTINNLKTFLEEFKALQVGDVFDSENARKAVERATELYKKRLV
jgi:inorganic pyrophosphatase